MINLIIESIILLYVYEFTEVIKTLKLQHNACKLKPYCEKSINYSKQYILHKNLYKSCRKHFKSSLRFKMKQELKQEYTNLLT
jgi:hypothetical protein